MKIVYKFILNEIQKQILKLFANGHTIYHHETDKWKYVNTPEFFNLFENQLIYDSDEQYNNQEFSLTDLGKLALEQIQEETVVSKLRNQLTPMYGLPQIIIAANDRPNDLELQRIITESALQAIENQKNIQELLTQLEVIESKQVT